MFASGSLQVEETSGYSTVNHRASASNYQLSNMKRPPGNSNQRLQRLEARTLTTTPPSPPDNVEPALVFNNYKKECFYQELYNVTYKDCMISGTDQLIEYQDQMQSGGQKPEDISDVSSTNSCTNKLTDPITIHSHLPTKIQSNIEAYVDSDRANIQLTDFHFSDKCRGFLLLESGSFDLIGPDRAPVTIASIDQCTALANVIRKTGKPNYQQARIPLNSRLNIRK